MKRLIWIIFLATAVGAHAFPVQTNTATMVRSEADGDFDQFHWRIGDNCPQRVEVSFDVSLTGYDCYFRMSDAAHPNGTAHLTLQTNSGLTISTTNLSFDIAQSNIPPPTTYYAEFVCFSGVQWAVLGQGKIDTFYVIANQTGTTTAGTAGYVPDSLFTVDGGFVVGTGVGTYQEETGSVAIASMDLESYFYTETEVDTLMTAQSNALQTQIDGNDTDITALQGATNLHDIEITALQTATGSIATLYLPLAGGTMTGQLTTDGSTNAAIVISKGSDGNADDSAGILWTSENGGDYITFYDDSASALRYTNANTGAIDTYALVTAHVTPLRTATQTLDTAVSALQVNTGTLNTAVATLQTDTNTLNTLIGTLQTDTGTLNTAVATLQTDTNTLQTYIASLWTDTNTLHAAVTNNDIDITALQAGTNDCLDRAGTRAMTGTLNLDDNGISNLGDLTYNSCSISDVDTDGQGNVNLKGNHDDVNNGSEFYVQGTNDGANKVQVYVGTAEADGLFELCSNDTARMTWSPQNVWNGGGGSITNITIGDGVSGVFVAKGGDTMTGNLNMDDNDISSVGTLGATTITGDGSGLTGLDAADVTNHAISVAGGWVSGVATAPTNYLDFGRFEYAVNWTNVVVDSYAGTSYIQVCSCAAGQSIYRGTIITNYGGISITNGVQTYASFSDYTTAAGDNVFVVLTNTTDGSGINFTVQGYEQ